MPSVPEFRNRIENILKTHPYLVLEEDVIIQGYAYARAFYGREAYRYSGEVSIYLDHCSRGYGYGRLLYEALEAELIKRGILNVYACIADPVEEDEYLTRNSEQFPVCTYLEGYRAGKLHFSIPESIMVVYLTSKFKVKRLVKPGASGRGTN